MASVPITREVVTIDRALEFLNARELTAQTGVPVGRFAEAVLKELSDNGLDAAETAGRPPMLRFDLDISDPEVTTIAVADNGPGLTGKMIERVLDFNTRTSDKVLWRSPTRGAQGNALKTIFGIPAAMAEGAKPHPVIIEAHGSRHKVTVWAGAAGELRREHVIESIPERVGTTITVTLSARMMTPDTLVRWGRSFALVNPHVDLTVRIRRSVPAGHLANRAGFEVVDSYRPTVDGYQKPLPTDPTSIHHYTLADFEKLVAGLAAAGEARGMDRTIRRFIRDFYGLTSTVKAKEVAEAVGVNYLSDLYDRRDLIARLHSEMRAAARVPKPNSLGRVPEEHMLACFDGWFGVERSWHRRAALVDNSGIPWTFDVLVAHTAYPGGFFPAVNWSPTYGDPTAGNGLVGDHCVGDGVFGFLHSADLLVDHGPSMAVALHIVTPALTWLDRGKSRSDLPAEVRQALAKVVDRASAVLAKEQRARTREWTREMRDAEQSRRSGDKKMSIKAAAFDVMASAYDEATGGGSLPVPARALAYVIRRLTESVHGVVVTGGLGYITQNLIPLYQRERGGLDLVVWEARGEMLEPHTGEVVDLGTLEVMEYTVPKSLYQAILIVEKLGLKPVFEAARIKERFDIAIAYTQGFGTTGARDLADKAQSRDIPVIILTDCDIPGLNIRRTMQEATERMPDHSVEAIDIGLDVDYVIEHDMPTETAVTKRDPRPSTLELTEGQEEFFGVHSTGRNRWEYTRCELNAFTAPEIVAYVEAKLEEHGFGEKLVPSDDVLLERANDTAEAVLRERVEDRIRHLIDFEAIIAEVAAGIDNEFDADDLRTGVDDEFDDDRTQPWRTAIDTLATKRRDEQEDEIRRLTLDALLTQIADLDEEAS